MSFDGLDQRNDALAQREETVDESSSSGSLSPLPEHGSGSSNEFENEESQHNEGGSPSGEPSGTPRSDTLSEEQQSGDSVAHGETLPSPQVCVC